jgi:hypothetical protein
VVAVVTAGAVVLGAAVTADPAAEGTAVPVQLTARSATVRTVARVSSGMA